MALRNFSSPFRISATANFSLFFILICLQFADLKRIDDGGITVPNRYRPDDPLDWDGGSSSQQPQHHQHHSASHHPHVNGFDLGQDQSGPHPPGRIIAPRNRPLRLPCPIKIAPSVRVLDLWWLKDGVQLNYHHQQQQQPLNPISQNQSGGGHPGEQSRIKLIGRDLYFDKIVHKVSGGGGGGSGGGGGGGGGSGNTNHTTTTSTSSTATAATRHRNYSDEGNYRCVVKTSGGVVLSPIISVAVAGLEVQDAVTSMHKKGGEWVLLQCSIRSVPRAQISWFRGDNSSLSQESDPRFKFLSSGTLLISNLQVTDSGTYRCVARNEVLKKERRSEVHLSVAPLDTSLQPEPTAPYFLGTFNENSHVVLEEDEDFAVDCIAYGVPLPSITWVLTYLYENETASIPVSTILSDGRTGLDTIYLTHNSTNHGYDPSRQPGLNSLNYTCVINNGIGPPLTKTIQVSRFPLLLKSMESQQFPPAKTVRFECRVPSPFYLIWYKDGQLLETGKGRVKTRESSLVISNTIRNDSGFYQCEVLADDRVYSVGTARLLVESQMAQPDAPVEIECKAESSRMISVSWKAGTKAEVKAFTIHYMAAGEEERQQVTKNTTFLIETLKPHTNYSIYVRSYSGHSASAQSQRVYCITLEDVPINVPRPLLFERFRISQVRVRWRPLMNAEARGRIILYKIQWRPVEGSFINVRFLDGRSDEFLIDLAPVAPNQLYEMRIIPATSVGYPVDKDSIPWTLIPGVTNPETAVPPNGGDSPTPRETGPNSTNTVDDSTENDIFSPPSVHLTVVNSTSISVTWIEPSPRANVTPKGFRILYATFLPRIDDIIYYGPFVVDYDIREYLFTDFAPATSYEISVQTFGEGWESDTATKSIRTFSSTPNDSGQFEASGGDALPAISGLQALPLSDTSIRLMWDPPKNVTLEPNNFYTIEYTIKYNRVDSSDFHYIRSTRESIDVKDLIAFTAYEFLVKGSRRLHCTGDRHCGSKPNQPNDLNVYPKEGPFSQKVESRTLPGIPGRVRSIDWKVTNNRTIQLSWLAPLEPNGLIAQYWVEYKNKSESQSQEFQPQGVTYFSPGGSNHSIGSSSSPSTLDIDWNSASTNTTSIDLQNLTPNFWYVVRVRAETKAGAGGQGGGVGQATVPMMVRIFEKNKQDPGSKPSDRQPHHHEPVNHEMQDAPNQRTQNLPNKQHLGILVGSVVGVACIIICITIIICRNRCFPVFARTSRHPSYVNGNGPRWKRSMESLNGVEMKALQSMTPIENHLDTKAGHPTSMLGPNRDGVSDPLLMKIVRNPIEQRQHDLDLDIEIRGNNCIR